MPGIAHRQPLALPYPYISGLSEKQRNELYEDFQAVARQGTGTRWATLVIAASDSTTDSKSKADYVCSGTNDTAKIQAAIDLLASRSRPGRIVFLEGTYTMTATLSVTVGQYGELVFQGMSSGGALDSTNFANCKIVGTGSVPVFTLNGVGASSNDQPLYGFLNLGIDGNSGQGIKISHNNFLRLVIDHCDIRASDAILTSGAGTTLVSNVVGAHITNNRISATSAYGVGLRSSTNVYIANNHINVSGAIGISIAPSGGDTGASFIGGNMIACSGGGTGIEVTADTLSGNGAGQHVIGNKVTGATVGVKMEHTDNSLIHGNLLVGCTTGILLYSTGITVPAGADNDTISGNFLSGCTTGITLDLSSTGGPRYASIVGNTARTCTTALVISAGAVSTREIGNDWGGLPTVDNGTSTLHASPGTDYGVVALTRVRKNSAGTSFERHRLNLIEGTGITLTVADDSVGDEVDVTVTSTAGQKARYNSGGSTFGPRNRFNFIPGAGITLTVADDAGDDEIDVTVAATGAGALIDVRADSGTTYTRGRINLHSGSGILVTASDDGTEVDVTVSTTGGGAANAAANAFLSQAFQ